MPNLQDCKSSDFTSQRFGFSFCHAHALSGSGEQLKREFFERLIFFEFVYQRIPTNN